MQEYCWSGLDMTFLSRDMIMYMGVHARTYKSARRQGQTLTKLAETLNYVYLCLTSHHKHLAKLLAANFKNHGAPGSPDYTITTDDIKVKSPL